LYGTIQHVRLLILQRNRRYRSLTNLIDLGCDEFCSYCSTTYTQASRFITHKCTNEGPDNQQRYIKTRIEALRTDAKRELGSRIREAADADSGPPRKRPMIDTGAHDGDEGQSASSHSLPEKAATPLEASSNKPSSQSRDTSFTDLSGSDHTSIGIDVCQSHIQAFQQAPPLFLPFSSSWHNMPEIPPPLWSAQSSTRQPAGLASTGQGL
jgi:hypothetical protein